MYPNSLYTCMYLNHNVFNYDYYIYFNFVECHARGSRREIRGGGPLENSFFSFPIPQKNSRKQTSDPPPTPDKKIILRGEIFTDSTHECTCIFIRMISIYQYSYQHCIFINFTAVKEYQLSEILQYTSISPQIVLIGSQLHGFSRYLVHVNT